MDLLTKIKYGLRNHILSPYFIHICRKRDPPLTILLRFNAMSDRRHFSVTAIMPRLQILKGYALFL